MILQTDPNSVDEGMEPPAIDAPRRAVTLVPAPDTEALRHIPTAERGRVRSLGRRLAHQISLLWFPPAGLPQALALEWRFVAVRWIGMLAVTPAILLARLDSSRQLMALAVLVGAALYNLGVTTALRRRPELLRSGYMTSLCDALLNVVLILSVGGFNSPFYFLLFTVTISAAMRYGYGQAASMVGVFVGLDAVIGPHNDQAEWTAYLCRSGFLAITALLAGYLREQARHAEEALEERLREAQLLDAAGHLLSTSLDVEQMRHLVAQAGCRLLGGDAAVVLPAQASTTASYGIWVSPGAPPEVLDRLKRLVTAAAPQDRTVTPLHLGTRAIVLALKLEASASPLAWIAVAVKRDTRALDDAVLDRFAERAALALEKSGLYQELSVRHAQLQAQADSDPLTGLLNHRAMLSQVDKVLSQVGHGALLLLDVDNFKLFNDTFGHLSGDAALRQTTAVLRETCPSGALVGRYGGDEFLIFSPALDPDGARQLANALHAAMRHVVFEGSDGVTIPLRLSIGIACSPENGRRRRELLLSADTAMYQDKRGTQSYIDASVASLAEASSFGVLESLVLAVDRKDKYTREHSLDVTQLALMLADQLGLAAEERRALALAGPLHDVGKIAIPDAILRKPGRLTDAEYTIVQNHVAYGVVFIRGVLPHEDAVLEAVQHHHERWDGQGYPQGVQGPETPLLGRLMQLADAVSAMMLDRPYRRGLPWATVKEELRASAGRQFDPALVEPFIDAIDRRPQLTSSEERTLTLAG